MEKKWSWSKFIIGFVICIVAGVIGRYTANYNFKKVISSFSSSNVESSTNMDSIVSYSDNTNSVEGFEKEFGPKLTIKKEFSVKAEVFRLVDGYYKDANRKETISIVVLSNGITMMKKHFDCYDRQSTLGWEEISKLPGYEYQCFSTDGRDDKFYAYNENDKILVSK